MANHYLLVGVASRDWDRIQNSPAEPDEYGEDFMNFYGILIRNEMLDIEDSVGSFGCYSLKVIDAEGDMSPKIIQIECRWKVPEHLTMLKLTEWLCAKFFLKAIAWISHDPADCSLMHISTKGAFVEVVQTTHVDENPTYEPG